MYTYAAYGLDCRIDDEASRSPVQGPDLLL